MDNQRIIIESLAMDLKRVALGLHRGSISMADRFKEEALKRQQELEEQETADYLKKLVQNSKAALRTNTPRTQEDALMYSTLFQNYASRL